MPARPRWVRSLASASPQCSSLSRHGSVEIWLNTRTMWKRKGLIIDGYTYSRIIVSPVVRLCKNIDSHTPKYWIEESTGFPLSIVNIFIYIVRNRFGPDPPKYRIY